MKQEQGELTLFAPSSWPAATLLSNFLKLSTPERQGPTLPSQVSIQQGRGLSPLPQTTHELWVVYPLLEKKEKCDNLIWE